MNKFLTAKKKFNHSKIILICLWEYKGQNEMSQKELIIRI